MRTRRRTVLVAAAQVLLGGCDARDGTPAAVPEAVPRDQGPLPCERGPARFWEPGATVHLVEREPLCVVRTTPVAVLEPSLEGSHPDPGETAVLLSTGQFLTWRRTEIALWSPSGEFQRAFGAAGLGPGEFAPLGITGVFRGPGDSIFVLDASQRWSVFDADFEFRRVFPGLGSGRDRQAMHATPVGILTTGAVVQDGSNRWFHVMSFDGAGTESFGPPASFLLGAARLSNVRLSADDGEGGFWVVPPQGQASGLTLEHWTLEGEHLLTLVREVPWLPSDGYSRAPDEFGPRLPEYDSLILDANGLLWVTVIVRDERWRPVSPQERAAVPPEELYDARLEVIDPATGVVLASLRIDGPADAEGVPVVFPGSDLGHLVSVPDSLGLSALEIVDVRLTSP